MSCMHAVVKIRIHTELLTIALWVELLFTGRSVLAVPGIGPTCNEQTWLILPVVICLSQRLSHACLSISFYTAKLRMAH